MIQISRLLARQLRNVLKKAFGRLKPDVRLIAGPQGLRVQAKGGTLAIEYCDPEPQEAVQLFVPFAVLQDAQGTRNEPVRLYCPTKKALAATWEDHGVERTMQYTLCKDDGTAFHATPTEFTDNSPALIEALRHAAQCTDPDSSRYALGCIQLRGSSGQVAATDGRQLLLQSGFSLGFTEEVLVHSTEVFGCAGLPTSDTVQVGKTDSHVVVRVGPWSFFLEIQKEGRFPRIEHVVPSVQSAKTTLELHSADAQFLAANIARLPGNAEERSITLDLNSNVAVRAKSIDTPQPVELLLTNSSKQGDDVTVCVDRRNLVRAAQLGFDRLYLCGNQNALLARDDHRSYVFMPLHEQNGVKASEDCLKIPSPLCTRSSVPRPHNHVIPQVPMTTSRIRPAPAMNHPPESTPDTSPQSIRRRRHKTGSSTVLEQAIGLRDQLRLTLTGTKELIRTLKAEKRSQKSLRQALDSLKQLQSAA